MAYSSLILCSMHTHSAHSSHTELIICCHCNQICLMDCRQFALKFKSLFFSFSISFFNTRQTKGEKNCYITSCTQITVYCFVTRLDKKPKVQLKETTRLGSSTTILFFAFLHTSSPAASSISSFTTA